MKTASIGQVEPNYNFSKKEKAAICCFPMALAAIIALGGLFLLLASFEILPNAYNAVSALGIFSKTVGAAALAVGALGLFILCKCRQLISGESGDEDAPALNELNTQKNQRVMEEDKEDEFLMYGPKNSQGKTVNATDFSFLRMQLTLEKGTLKLLKHEFEMIKDEVESGKNISAKLHKTSELLKKAGGTGLKPQAVKDPSNELNELLLNIEELKTKLHEIYQKGHSTIQHTGPNSAQKELQEANAAAEHFNRSLDHVKNKLDKLQAAIREYQKNTT